MKLWTYQGVAQSLSSGCVDHSKSTYYNTYATVRQAYATLATKVGTNKVIWCYVRDPGHAPEAGEVRYELGVPDGDIFRFTDDRVWNRILRFDIGVPDSLKYRWEIERPDCEIDIAAYNSHRKHEYLNQSPPGGCWWSNLFLDRKEVVLDGPLNEQLSSALLKHAIPISWIVGKTP
jgi:hypothetical protein